MLLNKFRCITAANLPHLALKIVVLQHILCSVSSLWTPINERGFLLYNVKPFCKI
jgi:hypothetical protein